MLEKKTELLSFLSFFLSFFFNNTCKRQNILVIGELGYGTTAGKLIVSLLNPGCNFLALE